ncbi:MAG: rhomboid family intramembrane serine protease [Gaiellaceae bacterium]
MLPLRDNVPTRSFPLVTVGLIAANVLVWLWEWTGRLEPDIARYGFYPCTLGGRCVGPFAAQRSLGPWESAFSSMFMHASWLHIGGNMLFLWIFGNNVEDALGKIRYLLWYLAGGLAATAAQTAVTLHFGNSGDASIPSVGASGAIAAVLGAYFLLLPRARVLTLVIIVIFPIFIELHALWFLGIWFLFQFFAGENSLTHPESGGGVAFFAHIGGFLFGLATVRLLARRKPLRPRS